MPILDSVLNSLSRIPDAPRAVQEYFQEHTLNDGFELSANNTDRFLQAHHAPNWLGGVAGSVLSAGQLLWGVPVGMKDMARVAIQASPQGWQHTIGAVGSFVIHGMVQGVGSIANTVSNWGNGSLNNQSSFQVARQVTLTTGAAGMMLMGARNMARGGGNFLTMAQNVASNAGEMSLSPASATAAVSSMAAAIPASGLPEMGIGILMSSASNSLAPRPEEVASIPGQRYVRGSRGPGSYENETPHLVDVSPFRILRTPFTNALLLRYWGEYFSTPFAIIGRDEAGIARVVQRGRSEAELRAWIGDHGVSSQAGFRGRADCVSSGGRVFRQDSLSIERVVPERPPQMQQGFEGFEQPAVNINWAESVSIADAMGGHLPTEAQWELEARGPIVNVTEQMRAEGVPSNRLAEFTSGPEINGRYESGRFGRYDNLVILNPTTMEMGTEIFTNPNNPRLQGMLREGQAIGARRVFSTESGAFEEPTIWSSVTRERSATRPVMEGSPGPFGARDMSGNEWEWGNDNYGPYTPANAGEALRDPTGPATASTRVLRGGSWGDCFFPGSLRAAYRGVSVPGNGVNNVGGRAVFPQD